MNGHPTSAEASNFTAFFETHVWDVFGFLAYRASSRPEAEDLTQETFERALKAWSRFDPARNSPRAWILTIARNVYVDSRRRAGSRPESPVSPETLEARGESAADIAAGGLDADLADALARLSRREREALALRFGGDLKVAEIAELLDVSVDSAQQTLSRALKRLRGMLGRPRPS